VREVIALAGWIVVRFIGGATMEAGETLDGIASGARVTGGPTPWPEHAAAASNARIASDRALPVRVT
jgi:hypothetical protein